MTIKGYLAIHRLFVVYSRVCYVATLRQLSYYHARIINSGRALYCKWLWDRSANDGGDGGSSSTNINRVSSDDINSAEEHRTRLLTEESNSTVDDTQCASLESTSIEDSNSNDDRPRLFHLFRRRRRTMGSDNNKNKKNNTCLLPSQSVEDESCNRSNRDDIVPVHSIDNINITDDDDNTCCIRKDDEFESLLPSDKAYIDEHITTLWKRRRRWSIQSLLRNREVKQKPIKCQATLGNTTTNTDRIKAGGRCNIERRMVPSKDYMQVMDVMLTEEKEREDLLYDLWIRDMNDLDMSDEPEFGWDNKGWYKSIESNYEIEEEDTSDNEVTNLIHN